MASVFYWVETNGQSTCRSFIRRQKSLCLLRRKLHVERFNYNVTSKFQRSSHRSSPPTPDSKWSQKKAVDSNVAQHLRFFLPGSVSYNYKKTLAQLVASFPLPSCPKSDTSPFRILHRSFQKVTRDASLIPERNG